MFPKALLPRRGERRYRRAMFVLRIGALPEIKNGVKPNKSAFEVLPYHATDKWAHARGVSRLLIISLHRKLAVFKSETLSNSLYCVIRSIAKLHLWMQS